MENEAAIGLIVKAATSVHDHLKCGFQEVVYQRALALEMGMLELEFRRDVWVPVYYKGKKIDTRRVDFVVQGVLVEIKAKSALEDRDRVQGQASLKSSGFSSALLINFGGEEVTFEKFENG